MAVCREEEEEFYACKINKGIRNKLYSAGAFHWSKFLKIAVCLFISAILCSANITFHLPPTPSQHTHTPPPFSRWFDGAYIALICTRTDFLVCFFFTSFSFLYRAVECIIDTFTATINYISDAYCTYYPVITHQCNNVILTSSGRQTPKR